MTRKNTALFSAVGARITSIFSVTLVLFILGIIALMGVVTDHITDEIKANMGFDIVMTDDASEANLNHLRDIVSLMPYTREVIAHSSAEAARQWQLETGEDVEDLLGVNPFSAQIEVKVQPQWANTDSLRAITSQLKSEEFVDEIALQADMIDTINSNISTLALALSVVALALLFISFVLINNTVRLTVYAKRFIIHTMRLVGATASFIRRPFIINNMIQGVVAGVIAVLLLSLLWSYVSSFDPIIATLVSIKQLVWISLSIIACGIIICGVAAYWAAGKYISLSYDEMFS